MQKLFVWDFHGTLEKGNERAALDISNLALQKHGFAQRFSEQEGYDLYGKKWYEYFEYLLPTEPHDTHILLQQTSFDWPDAEAIIARYLQPNDYALDVLGAIKDRGHGQIVISNTTPQALPIFVTMAQMDHIFDSGTALAVMAHKREVKRSKLDVLQEYLELLGADPEIIVIGDSEKDMSLVDRPNRKGYFYRHPYRDAPVYNHPNVVVTTDLRRVLAEL